MRPSVYLKQNAKWVYKQCHATCILLVTLIFRGGATKGLGGPPPPAPRFSQKKKNYKN